MVIAWLLGAVPCEPLPTVSSRSTVEDLRAFRDALAERLRHLVVPGSPDLGMVA